MALDRTPGRLAEGLVAGRSRSIGSGQVSYTLVTSEYIKRLLYSGPKASGVIAEVNRVHRIMASEIAIVAKRNYEEARSKRPNKRRDARRHYKMERELAKMAEGRGLGYGVEPGSRHPVFRSASGAQGIRAGNGFTVDFTALDTLVTNTESGGRSNNFPYWRSLEFGYASFSAYLPLFSRSKRGTGPFTAPTRFFSDDPRMPQGFGHAPYERVQIRGFGGYSMFRDAIQQFYSGRDSFTRKGSFWYYPEVLARERALPPEWMSTLGILQSGGSISGGRLRGPSGRFVSDPR